MVARASAPDETVPPRSLEFSLLSGITIRLASVGSAHAAGLLRKRLSLVVVAGKTSRVREEVIAVKRKYKPKRL
jgi:hypothetical protein